MNIELDENEVMRLISAMENSSRYGQPELARKLRHALNISPKTRAAWPENLGRAIYAEMANINNQGIINETNYPVLIAHVLVMCKERAITTEQADRLMHAINASKAKPLVDQGWRDVAADAIREGNFAQAVQIVIREDPKAWPYIKHLETIKDMAKRVLQFRFNAAGKEQHPEVHAALEELRAAYDNYTRRIDRDQNWPRL